MKAFVQKKPSDIYLLSPSDSILSETQKFSFKSARHTLGSLILSPRESSRLQKQLQPYKQSLISDLLKNDPPKLSSPKKQNSLLQASTRLKLQKRNNSIGYKDSPKKMGTTLTFPFKTSNIKLPTVDSMSVQTIFDSPKKKKNNLKNNQSFYDSILSGDSKQAMKHTRNLNSRRTTDAMLLLSDYRPTEFGNTKIDLTIDGGQHLRSPEDDTPPQVTHKNVQSIFRDPVFDHKEKLQKMEEENRKILLSKVKFNMEKLNEQLYSPQNFKSFFHFNKLNIYGFGTKEEIKMAKHAALISDCKKSVRQRVHILEEI